MANGARNNFLTSKIKIMIQSDSLVSGYPGEMSAYGRVTLASVNYYWLAQKHQMKPFIDVKY